MIVYSSNCCFVLHTEVCVLVSSDDEVIVTGSQEGGNKKKRDGVKSLLSLEQIMDGVR